MLPYGQLTLLSLVCLLFGVLQVPSAASNGLTKNDSLGTSGINCSFVLVHLRQRSFKIHRPILNLSSSRKLLILFFMIAGDCNIMNPGPIKFPCGICSRPVQCNQRAIECEQCQSWFHLNCIAMSVQSYSDYNDDSKLVWLCNMCLFPNFSTSFLLGTDFSNENSFKSLACEGDSPGQPLHTFSPSSTGAHHHVRMKSTKRKLKFLLMNCYGLKSNSKKAAFYSMIDLH